MRLMDPMLTVSDPHSLVGLGKRTKGPQEGRGFFLVLERDEVKGYERHFDLLLGAVTGMIV
jgi:hypothetical protein